jgi:hypothetical protein
VNNGSAFCSECVAYQPVIDNNPCSSTYNQTSNQNLGATAPCDYSAAWVNRDINTYYVCVGVDKYYQQINTNPCYTGTQTQTGALYQVNSVDCGYVAINVSTFAAFKTYNEISEDWTLTVQVTLDGNVNADTVIDATVNLGPTGEDTQVFGVTISNGTSTGTSNNGYLEDPGTVGPNCLTFSSGDSRVNVGAYACP